MRRNASVRSRRLLAMSSTSLLNSAMAALVSSLGSFCSICFRKSLTSSRSSGAMSTGSMVLACARGTCARTSKSMTATSTPQSPPAAANARGMAIGTANRGRVLGATAIASSIAASMKGVRCDSSANASALARRSCSPWKRSSARAPERAGSRHTHASTATQATAAPASTRMTRASRSPARPNLRSAMHAMATTSAAQSAFAPTCSVRPSRMRRSACRASRRICSIPCS